MRELNAVEKGIRADDPAAIATAKSWSAKELNRRFESRRRIPCFWFVAAILLSVLIMLVFHGAGVTPGLVALPQFFLTCWSLLDEHRRRSSPAARFISDADWINTSVTLNGDLDETNIHRLLAELPDKDQFQLTVAAETALQKRLDRYARGTEDGFFVKRAGGLLVAELLANYGSQAKSGEMLQKLVSPECRFGPAPELAKRFQEASFRFANRKLDREMVAGNPSTKTSA